MKKRILIILLVLTWCNQEQIKETPNQPQAKNEFIIEKKDYRKSWDWCSYGSRLIVNVDEQSVSEIAKVLSSKESCMHNYDRTQIEVQMKNLNPLSLNLFRETNIHRDLEEHRLLFHISTVENSNILYDLLKFINRNIAVHSVSIYVEDTNIKIDDKLFTEILQNSRFAYSVNLEFDDSFSQIEILRRMQSSNTISLNFKNYGHWKSLDDNTYLIENTRRTNFLYNWKRAQYYVKNWEEIFEYFEWPWSESVPFEYGE